MTADTIPEKTDGSNASFAEVELHPSLGEEPVIAMNGNYALLPNSDAQQPPQSRLSVFVAYLFWLPPFGLLGTHRFYLGDPLVGTLFMCTLGNCGVSWFLDGFRIPSLYAEAATLPLGGKLQKSKFDAYSLWLPLPLGILGAHRLYLDSGAHAFYYLITGGNATFGWLADLFRIPSLVREKNTTPNLKTSVDAYILWFGPAGILGGHRMYLSDYTHAFFYFFTAGNACLGWIFDLGRIPSLVRHKNSETANHKSTFDAFLLWLPPCGLLGAHRFYTTNCSIGLAWLFTAANGGLGWLFDLFRLPFLVADANEKKTCCERGPISPADAYILWFPPLGLFGAHRYYLGYYISGLVYTFTIGLFGLGWIFDLFFLPCMYTKAKEQERVIKEKQDCVLPVVSPLYQNNHAQQVLAMPAQGFVISHEGNNQAYYYNPVFYAPQNSQMPAYICLAPNQYIQLAPQQPPTGSNVVVNVAPEAASATDVAVENAAPLNTMTADLVNQILDNEKSTVAENSELIKQILEQN